MTILLPFFLFLCCSSQKDLNLYVTYNETITEKKCSEDSLKECGTFEKPFSSFLQATF